MALPADIQAFLETHVDSLQALEILVTLHHEGRSVRARELAERVGITEAEAARELETLVRSGLLARSDPQGSFQLGALSEETKRLLAGLADEYAVHKIDVIHAIYSVGLRRLRVFADAFKLRKP